MLANFLHVLVADPRSHRAIDETLTDWSLEADQAPSAVVRAFCHIRSVAAVLRTLVFSAPREIGQVPFLTFFGRAVLLLSIPLAILALSVTPVRTHPLLFAHFFGEVGLQWLPSVWFLVAAWPLRRQIPALSASTAVAFAMVLLVAWVRPDPLNWGADVAGAVVLSAGLVLLGTSVAFSSPRQRWAWRAAVPTAVILWRLLTALATVSFVWPHVGVADHLLWYERIDEAFSWLLAVGAFALAFVRMGRANAGANVTAPEAAGR